MLSDDKESDAIKQEIQNIRRNYKLEDEPLKKLEAQDYQKFREDLERIKYAGRLDSQVLDSISINQ